MTTVVAPPNGWRSFTPIYDSDWTLLEAPENLSSWLEKAAEQRIKRCYAAWKPRAAHQLPSDEPWSTWLFLGGRGAGKTFAGPSWIKEQARQGGSLALVGPTFHDVREVMIEGPSGLKSLYPPGRRPKWQASPVGAWSSQRRVAQAFSAEDPDSLRGPQFHAAWADEFCAWPKPAETLAMLRFGLRLGTDPRLVVTTTPRPIRALRNLIAEPGTVDTRAPTASNAAHLAPAFLSTLQALYGGTRLAAQELDGLIVEGEGGLFRAEDLARCRGAPPAAFDRVVVAVDPPATAGGDACGIVVCGRFDGRAFVLEDRTAQGPVAQRLGPPRGRGRRALERRRPGGRGQPGRRHGPLGPGPGRPALRGQAGQGLGRQAGAGRAGGGAVRAGPGGPLRGLSGPGGGADGPGLGRPGTQPGPGGCPGLGGERADAGGGEAAAVVGVVDGERPAQSLRDTSPKG
jgi:phage terminase large subunit-like protein